MEEKHKDNNFSFIRALFCLAILFYHLGLLKGGYLAVCSLFVLAGYFTIVSLSKNIKLLPYYKKRLSRIYHSLVAVIFFSVIVIWLMNIDVINLKSEVKSIIFGYNNYWQLKVNTDYFAKGINSPFTHLWYMSILIQLQLVFSLIYIGLKKLGDKVHKSIPSTILFLICVISTIFFCYIASTKDVMVTYYDTLSRMFSFVFGLFLGSYHMNYNKSLIEHKNKTLGLLIYIFCLIILMVLFSTVTASSNIFVLSLFITTLITILLIEEGIALYKDEKKLDNKLICFISNISYEIYLVQYPVIFFFDYVKMNSVLKIILIIIVTVIISWLINIIMQPIKDDSFKKTRITMRVIAIILTVFGIYQLVVMKDYSNEINKLKESLANKQELIKKKQKEYMKKQKQENKELEEYIKSLEVNEKELKEYVTNLRIVGVGDSIMLDPVDSLYRTFPNGYFDAEISRTTCAGYEVLKDIKNSGIKWDVLVFNLGTNGYPNDRCKSNLMSIAGDSKVFWLNATHADYDNNNSELEKFAKNYDNIYILDWVSEVEKHPDYLYRDATHLREHAYNSYAEYIRDEIYKVFLDEYNKEKEKNIEEAIARKTEKITFYGNDLLVNIFDELHKKYPDSKFVVDEKVDVDKLLTNIKKDLKKNTLNDRLVFVYDKESELTKKDYKKIAKLCKNQEIYIISLDNMKIKEDNVTVINLNLDDDDYLKDKIHLKDKTNNKLIKKINKVIN